MNKNIIKFILKIGFCFILFWLLLSKVDISQIGKILAESKIHYFIFALFLCFLNTSISALKWKLLLKSDGIDLPFRYLLQSYLVGTFMNIFLPSSIGGDVFRVYDVARKSQSKTKSLASVFIDRASGFFALSVIGLIASASAINILNNNRLIIIVMSVFALISFAFVSLFNKFFHNLAIRLVTFIPVAKIKEVFKNFINSLDSYKNQKSLFIKILAISFCFQSMVMVIIYIYTLGLQIDLSFRWIMIFIPIITVLESLPLTPFALGMRDWGYVFFFTKVGLSFEQAESMAITYVLITIVYSLIGGLVFIFRKN